MFEKGGVIGLGTGGGWGFGLGFFFLACLCFQFASDATGYIGGYIQEKILYTTILINEFA